MTQAAGGATVIVIPQPTLNGPLHVGHLSGPFIAADIASRAARGRGERVFTLAGVDVHPNFVMAKADNRGVDVHEMVADYRSQIQVAFDLARIGYDTFLDPEQPAFERAINLMLNQMLDTGSLEMREMVLHQCADCGRTLHHAYVVGKCPHCGSGANGLSCEPCGGFTSASTLIQPSCARCGGDPQPMVATVPVLRLENHREQLIAEWTKAELPARVRSVIGQYLTVPLPDYPVAYPTDWGIEGTGALSGLRIDFPAELGLSYLYGPASALDPSADSLADWVAVWQQQFSGLWHFNGIDNAFYFAVLYPAVFAAAGIPEPKMRGATVNELFLLEGLKFSSSRNHALWANEFLASEDPELVRLFLSWHRPDRYETNFTDESFRAFSSYVRPLLDGTFAGAGLPAQLAAGELERAEQSLQLTNLDPAMALRCLLGALSSGHGYDSVALTALTGRPAGR
ncbi:class I tRNA ligase family protein [Jatrophihabitans sp.]|uniref:class I tRNA ligase family protein n=1 Tax=Jatrophihabitans sp. TaxID=1932789 RepID=UPI002CCBC8A9|nr:class I tRNA ligase family protein [Jatrophihabitans sp.]